MTREYNGPYNGENLNHPAFPLGGLGAGMVCLEGMGALSHLSLRHRPEIFRQELMFGALCVKSADGNVARIIEGRVPAHKVFGKPGTGHGLAGTNLGLPRFDEAEFTARFPFGAVRLKDPALPVEVELTGWSPFIPGETDNSCLPAAGLEYRFRNTGERPVEAVFSFHAANFMRTQTPGHSVKKLSNGLVFHQP